MLISHRLPAALALAALTISTLSACGSSDTASPASANEFGAKKVASVAALVPASAKSKAPVNAVYNDYAPQSYLKDGKLTGLQVDFIDAAAAVMGIKVKDEATGSFDAIIPGLKSKRYDLSSSDFGVTAERVMQVDFVTMFDLGTNFAVKKGSTLKIATANDLCGRKVGALAGSYFVPQVKQLSKDCLTAGEKAIDQQTFPQQAAAVLALKTGRVDAYAASSDQVAYTIKQGAGIQLTDLVVSPIPQGVAFQKGSDLVPAFEAAFKEMISSGVYASILKKWGLESVAWTNPENVKVNNTKAS